MALYEWFNRVEGVLWCGVAVVVHFVLRPETGRKRSWLGIASVLFVLFGVTDFLEVPYHGRLPLWLWGLKVACGAALLACRFGYVGWDRFHLGDRSVLFGAGCLLIVAIVIVVQSVWLTG